jgi:hypothetical protein
LAAIAGRRDRMGAWLLVIVVAVGVVLWRLIGVAGVIWQQRARVTAHCAEMDAAASSRAILYERLPDGTTLLVMPGSAGQEQAPGAEVIPMIREMTP